MVFLCLDVLAKCGADSSLSAWIAGSKNFGGGDTVGLEVTQEELEGEAFGWSNICQNNTRQPHPLYVVQNYLTQDIYHTDPVLYKFYMPIAKSYHV